MGKRIDLTGKVFGRLTVLKREPKPEGSRDRHSRWLCKCSCGEVIVTTSDNLLSGGTKSCGCIKKETSIKNIMEYNNSEHESKNKTHGMTKTRLYDVYGHMRRRCYNKNDKKYPLYGGRGIEICEEWRDSPEKFFTWANDNGYRNDLTIDRIDVNGNYSPDNCRWVTLKEQANNRRNTIFINIGGNNYTLSQVSEITGISRGTLWYRKKHGYSDEQIIMPLHEARRDVYESNVG